MSERGNAEIIESEGKVCVCVRGGVHVCACVCLFGGMLDDRWAGDEEREKIRCRERQRRRDGTLSSSIHGEYMNIKAFKKRATISREVEAARALLDFTTSSNHPALRCPY